MTEKELSETGAQRIVSAVLGVEVIRVDGPGAPQGSPDFEIRFDDEAVPLEVTRSTDSDYRSFWNAVSRTARHIHGVASSWQRSTRYGSVNVRRLWKVLASVLPELEAAGIRHFGDGAEPEYPAEAAHLLELGVVRGRTVELRDADGRSLVFLGNAGGFVTSPEVLNRLCEVEFANNQAKLGDRGQLFVWVDSLSHEAWVGIDLEAPPRDRPKLPPDITVWVARDRETGNWNPDRLWRLSPGHTWETMAVP